MDILSFCQKRPDCDFAWEIFAKAKNYLSLYNNPACFVSGGADSDIMLDIIFNADDEKKVRYVFFDTGIEMDATKRHINYLEKKYGITIEKVRPKTPIPIAVKQYGMPVFNKIFAQRIGRLQKHNFSFSNSINKSFDELYINYGKCKSGLRWYCNDFTSDQFNIGNYKLLKEYMAANEPDFMISEKCCYYTKKLPAYEYCKKNNIDLSIVGVRKNEGGSRSVAYSSCYSEHTHDGYAQFRPLFWMRNDEKEKYKIIAGISYSDAYTVYGCQRTGCAGCPFARNWKKELKMLSEYEPKLYNACVSIFGKSYDYMDGYYNFRVEIENGVINLGR